MRVLRVTGQVVLNIDFPVDTDVAQTEEEALQDVAERLLTLTCGADVDISELVVEEEEWE